MTPDLATRINSLLDHHELWTSRDFSYSQWILWTALLASFAATISVSFQKMPKWAIAILAALPALALTVDKTFRYRDRSMWHELYALELHNLQEDLDSNPTQKPEIEKSLKKLRRDMHGKWPGENIFAIPAPPKDTQEPAPAPPTPKDTTPTPPTPKKN